MVIFHSQVSARMSSERQRKGQEGEERALVYLTQQGLSLVERNYRCKGGEIDLVMRAGGTLVFVEVRRRAGADFGGAAASVTPVKQARMVNAAQHYLKGMSHPPPCRFDIIAFEGSQLNWLKNVIQF